MGGFASTHPQEATLSAQTVQALFEASVMASQSREVEPLREVVTALLSREPTLSDPIVESLRADGLTETLRGLAQEFDSAKQGAHGWPLIEAAALLAPESLDVRRTHLLLAMSTLRDTTARSDAARLMAAADDHGRTLGAFVGHVFADATFDPLGTTEQLAAPSLHAPAGADSSARVMASVGRSVDELNRLVGVLAARLQRGRKLLIQAGADEEAAWLPPHVEVQALPTLGPAEWLDPELTPLEVVHTTRQDWGVLGALCALCGRRDVGVVELPTSHRLGAALQWSQWLLWRIRDQQLTGGAGADLEIHRGLVWRGQDVGSLAPALLQLAEREVAPLCAAFDWLAGKELEVFMP